MAPSGLSGRAHFETTSSHRRLWFRNGDSVVCPPRQSPKQKIANQAANPNFSRVTTRREAVSLWVVWEDPNQKDCKRLQPLRSLLEFGVDVSLMFDEAVIRVRPGDRHRQRIKPQSIGHILPTVRSQIGGALQVHRRISDPGKRDAAACQGTNVDAAKSGSSNHEIIEIKVSATPDRGENDASVQSSRRSNCWLRTIRPTRPDPVTVRFFQFAAAGLKGVE